MSVQSKSGSKVYKNIKYTYSVYGENNVYGGHVTITVHYGSYTETPMITLNSDYTTLDAAEDSIIACATKWIDNI